MAYGTYRLRYYDGIKYLREWESLSLSVMTRFGGKKWGLRYIESSDTVPWNVGMVWMDMVVITECDYEVIALAAATDSSERKKERAKIASEWAGVSIAHQGIYNAVHNRDHHPIDHHVAVAPSLPSAEASRSVANTSWGSIPVNALTINSATPGDP